MSKRFIDTGIFDDDWFMDLSKEGKLLWVYFITKCDHAGILKLNEKLCRVQTGIEDLTIIVKELGNRLVTVSEHLYFIPKYIEFQYPGFPNSKVRQQASAFEILTKYKLIIDGKLTVSKELVNSYVNDTVIDTVIVLGGVGENNIASFDEFWSLYDKNVDQIKCEVLWMQMNNDERIECIKKLPEYIKSTPEKKFRQDPNNYLKSKGWNNEIINQGDKSKMFIDNNKSEYNELKKQVYGNAV